MVEGVVCKVKRGKLSGDRCQLSVEKKRKYDWIKFYG